MIVRLEGRRAAEEGHTGIRTHIITQIKRGDRDREKGEAEREQGGDQVGLSSRELLIGGRRG